VNGYTQNDYRRAFGDHPADSARHEFAIRRARLGMSGKPHERVSLTVVLAGDRPTSRNPVVLLDAYADLEIRSWLKARAGQFKYDFDLEGREADERTPMLDRAFATNAVAGSMTGTSTPSTPAAGFRDRGAELIASRDDGTTRASFALGIFQGSGRASDENSEFGYTAQLRASGGGATVNVGFLGNRTSRYTTVADTTVYLGDVDYRAWTAAVDHVWRWNHFRAEAHAGDLDPGIAQRGGYVLDIVRVHPAVDVLARWQLYEVVQDERQITAFNAGVRWFLLRPDGRTNTWIALDYITRDADPPLHTTLTSLNDGAGVAIASPDDVGDVLVARLQVAF
jgi:hypothetical protein